MFPLLPRHHPAAPPVPAATVLLVDSHEDSLQIYTLALRHFGYVVLAAAVHPDGESLARAHQPDLVVLALTSQRAWESLRALREDPGTARIPIVALSTSGAAQEREQAVALGCADYLLKPCPPMELIAVTRRILGSE